MTSWDDLTTTALLGTDRRPAAVEGIPGPLGRAVAALSPADPAATLLGAAALATPYLRAGRCPGAAAATRVTPADDDPAPCVPPAAAARLAHLLARLDTALLAEWLAAAAARGYRAPPECLPEMLAVAVWDAALGAAVVPVLGERGRWLAQFRPGWSRLVVQHAGRTPVGTPSGAPAGLRDPAADTELWGHGDPGARRDLLAALTVADPASASALLAGSWKGENGEDREAFLDTIGAAAGESLLERALDDRRQAVRARAADLLRLVPGSALSERMGERVRTAFRHQRGLLRSKLIVTGFDACDETMVRDGITPNPAPGHAPPGAAAQGPTGAQGWWVQQVVAAAPLSTWTALTRLEPSDITLLTIPDGWNTVVRHGLAQAVLRERDPRWVQAIHRHFAVRPESVPPGSVSQLVLLLDDGERARAVADGLTHPGRGLRPDQVDEVLAALPRPWPTKVTAAAMSWLTKQPGNPQMAVRRLRVLSDGLSPRVADEVRAIADHCAPDSLWRPLLVRVADTLELRHQMLEELR